MKYRMTVGQERSLRGLALIGDKRWEQWLPVGEYYSTGATEVVSGNWCDHTAKRGVRILLPADGLSTAVFIIGESVARDLLRLED